MTTPLTPIEKAALVMLSLDEQMAAEVVKHLDPRVLRALVESADKLDGKTANRFPEALDDFAVSMAQPVLAHDAGGYLRNLASATLGADRAKLMLSAHSDGPPAWPGAAR
jgi:flagellar motor switch protein FliG